MNVIVAGQLHIFLGDFKDKGVPGLCLFRYTDQVFCAAGARSDLGRNRKQALPLEKATQERPVCVRVIAEIMHGCCGNSDTHRLSSNECFGDKHTVLTNHFCVAAATDPSCFASTHGDVFLIADVDFSG